MDVSTHTHTHNIMIFNYTKTDKNYSSWWIGHVLNMNQ